MDSNRTASRAATLQIALAVGLLAVSSACTPTKGHRFLGSVATAKNPRVAVDGNGRAVAIWTETFNTKDENGTGADGLGEIVAAECDIAAGTFDSFKLYADQPSRHARIGAHADGSAHAAWIVETLDRDGDLFRVQGARRSADGTWSLATIHDGREPIRSLELATNARGDALLAWRTTDHVFSALESADGSADWSVSIELAQAAEMVDMPGVTVALGAFGDGLVVYPRPNPDGSFGLAAHHFAAGRDPLEAVAIEDGVTVVEGDEPGTATLRHVAAAVDGTGNAAVLWLSKDLHVVAQRYEPGSGWQGATTLGSEQSETYVFVACDSAGTAWASWEEGPALVRSEFVPGAGWTASAALNHDNNDLLLDLAVSPSGRAISIVDSLATGSNADVFLPGLGWTGLAPLPYAVFNGDVDVGDDGSAVWIGLNQPYFPAGAAVTLYVWSPPIAAIASPSAPITAGLEATLTSAGSRALTWSSGLALYEWDLDGDGIVDATEGPQPGDCAVKHTFATPGTFDVTLRVTDEWGLSAQTTTSIVVEDSGGNPLRRLLVLESGGTGVVTSDNDSDHDGTPDIVCPEISEADYADGPAPDDHAQVYLRVTADAGFAFLRWEGLDPYRYFDGDYGPAGCLVQMVADRTITAVFVAY